MENNENRIKWYIKIHFNDGSDFFGIALTKSNTANLAIKEVIGDQLVPFTVMTRHQNGLVIINPSNVAGIFFYNNDQYED